MRSETVHLFFACDEKYLSLFAASLASVKANCDKERRYDVRVLHTDISEGKRMQVLEAFREEWFDVSFHDLSEEVSRLSDALHTRDYYSRATYYRLFIPTLFPFLKKALYLDSDVIVTGDVSLLYETSLEGCLVGAVADGFVNHVPVLRKYVENRVGVTGPYFNAGVLLMNLELMREISFGRLFLTLLSRVTFRVAQDQDYLNVICRGRVRFLSEDWNYMPFQEREGAPSLIHFNLDQKPWQRDGILFAEEFWRYARMTPFFDEISAMRAAYSEADDLRAREETEALIALAVQESEDEAENARFAEEIARILAVGEVKV